MTPEDSIMHFVSCLPWASTIMKRCHDVQVTSSRISLRLCDRCNPFYWAIFLIAGLLCRHDSSFPTTAGVNSEPRTRRNQSLLTSQDLFVIQQSGLGLRYRDANLLLLGPAQFGLKLRYERCVLMTVFCSLIPS